MTDSVEAKDLCDARLREALAVFIEQVRGGAAPFSSQAVIDLVREIRKPRLDEAEARLRVAEEKIERVAAQVIALSNTLQFRLPARRAAIQRTEAPGAAAQ